MITEIPFIDMKQYAAMFSGSQPEMVVTSIVEGNTAGQLWLTGAPGGEQAALLWDKGNNVFYLAGDLHLNEIQADLGSLVTTTIRPGAIAERLAYFGVCPVGPNERSVVPAIFAGVAFREVQKAFYRYPTQDAPGLQTDSRHAELRFVPIDRHLLEAAEIEGVAEVRQEVGWMWPSLERFYAHGFGVAALSGDQLVCWCTAEYVSTAACGIGIATHPDHQNRGIATATARRFVAESLRRGLIPHWECSVSNLGSVCVAEKVGFELISSPIFQYGEFKPAA